MARAFLVLALLLPADISPRGEFFRPASARMVATLKVGAPLNSFHYSRDGRRVVVLATDGKLSVWDIATRRQVRQMPGTSLVNRFQVSADGTRALVGNSDRRSLRLVDLERGEDLRTFTEARPGWLFSFSLSPDGRKVVYQRRDGTLKLYDAQSGEELRTIAETAPQQSVAWSPNGQVLALHSGADASVRFYDTTSWEEKGSLADNAPAPRYLGFTPDSTSLVHINMESRMKIIDTSGRVVK